jgi:hypothetical protein
MAGEQKKPKIDLKSRIPSKTVKGLTPASGGGGAIPPPPGAVPAPPPDLLGRRSVAPTADRNDPLGAATGGSSSHAQPQIVVVNAAEQEGVAGAASKKGVLYGLIGAAAIVGLGIGFVVGSATKGNEVKSKATSDAKELQAKVTKTNENLQKFLDTLKAAQSELQNSAQLTQPTIDAIKGWSSGFTSSDLKGREIAYFGEDTGGKLYAYMNKVSHIDDLRAGLTKGGGLEAANAQIKAFAIPKDHAKWGVKINKSQGGKDDPPMMMADLIDFGEPVNLKAKESIVESGKEKKLKIKSGEVDIDPGPKDFFSKGYVSPIESKDWLKSCPVYAQAVGYTRQGIDEMVLAIEGSGDDRGTLTPGKELADKLKSLAK